MNKMSIRKDDLVVVLSGKDKGKQEIGRASCRERV